MSFFTVNYITMPKWKINDTPEESEAYFQAQSLRTISRRIKKNT